MKYAVNGYVAEHTSEEEFVKGVAIMTEGLFRKMSRANAVPLMSTFKIECKPDMEMGGTVMVASADAMTVEPRQFFMSEVFTDFARGKD